MDKTRLAKLLSVSIGSCQFQNYVSVTQSNACHSRNSQREKIYTSTEHEIQILPTTMSDEDGSKRLNTSNSESDSCKIASFKHKGEK